METLQLSQRAQEARVTGKTLRGEMNRANLSGLHSKYVLVTGIITIYLRLR
jgi:hypothetical protein